ncbi:DJ-1 family glyoxalase III [Aliivibrio fischeri]|uniref:DJ-1 family glyoxalase III n=1 Tax=Aliivibrio fischeri TaxID=668 RepID=UPI0007C51959|nr:DJ-1 family glyoxalase III [Aliivibrio fischeri]MCE7537219.1 DJ-1/PfpI family protein [Aliivibrio fischeri]MCE7555579.1 DJ-1/PfpI family protein [Aliivibrio fischeri]MCE7559918.1 DJ-1/PfpI family protein [Aliivibrio fischeri]MCE7563409.1 DJ-1/PfpI family protein [Aliivibrio fischeri]MCE7566862.1 DJ-1/PfpI family protein [Aliivibrio fischeri]
MTKKILVCIAPGTEELEAITVIDILERAKFDVTVASTAFDGSLTMKAAQRVVLTADVKLVEVADEEFDCIVLPGGLKGSENFRDSTLLIEMLKQQKYDEKWVAAICAAPAIVLQHHNLYPDALMTCYPSFMEAIPEKNRRIKRVFTDVLNHLITSQGPGSALEFAMEIVTTLAGKELTAKLAAELVTLPNLNYHQV